MIDIPPSEVPLELTTLSETWLSTMSIDLSTLSRYKGNHTWLPSEPNWRCAVNFEHKILFTQLISSTHLMLDGYYEYLLAIDDNLIIIAWDCGEASIRNAKAYENFDIKELKKLINRCTELTTADHKAFIWKESNY